MDNRRHISEFYGVGVLLAIVGGMFDAYSYICRDGVFANAQTGNMVILGLRLTEGKFSQCLYYIMPILSFVVGIFIVELLKSKFSLHPKIHWHHIILEIEILLVLIVGFIPTGKYNTVANIIISFTCAMQVEAFRKMNGNAFATTMCTGNLRSGTENIFQYFKTKNKTSLGNALQYYGIILFFIIGAIVGVLLSNIFSQKSILFSIFVLIIALIVLKCGDRIDDTKTRQEN